MAEHEKEESSRRIETPGQACPDQPDPETEPSQELEPAQLIHHEHARILREALSRITRIASPAVAQTALNALRQYAIRVQPYCLHTDVAEIKSMIVCIDCGAQANANLIR